MSILITDLEVKRGQRDVIRGLNLSVAPGELVAVIGANGAGKSTLLGALAGDLPYTAGSISLDNRPVVEWTPKALARRRAVLRQSPRLDLRFSVLEVVLMGRTPHLRRHESLSDLRIARAALELVDLTGFEARVYPELSGGEQQRVHLARVLAQVWNPAIEGTPDTDDRPSAYLLLDEPTANLDVLAQHSVLRCARRFAESGGAVLCVLHDINLAAQYADRVVLLAGGVAIADGPPNQVLTPARLHQTFSVNSTIIRPAELAHPVIVAEPRLHPTPTPKEDTAHE